MNSNDYQIGGNHYASEYQHWDFVCDVKLHYLIACATKYVSRWRKKAGIEDLKKSKHYLFKARERKIYPDRLSIVGTEETISNEVRLICWSKFANRLTCLEDRAILNSILNGRATEYEEAIRAIDRLITKTECELEAGPDRSYVDPDSYFRG